MHQAAVNDPMRVAIVGCGAVAEMKHLPSLMGSKMLIVKALVEPQQERLKQLGQKFGIENLLTTIDGIEQYADLAIVATPHHLHAPLGISLMKKGLHILVEKPLATTVQEALSMIDTARQHKRKINVGLIRRFYPSYRLVRQILEQGWLGEIETFDFREGSIFSWPAVSDTLFRKDSAGGVLYDVGSHTLDMLLSWLGEFQAVEYWDDNVGGVEANCLLKIGLKNGVQGTVELSRTRQLRNTCIIKGTKGELEVGTVFNGPLTLRIGHLQLSGGPSNESRPKKSAQKPSNVVGIPSYMKQHAKADGPLDFAYMRWAKPASCSGSAAWFAFLRSFRLRLLGVFGHPLELLDQRSFSARFLRRRFRFWCRGRLWQCPRSFMLLDVFANQMLLDHAEE